jgi:hypothetical protein
VNRNLGASPQLEYWNTGMMGSGEEKELNMIFSAFTTHYSIFSLFHVATINQMMVIIV